MLWPAAETFGHVEAHLPPVLVPPEERIRLRAVVRRLPEAAASSFYLECRLGGGKTQPDFLACATTRDGGRDALAADEGTVADGGTEEAFRRHLHPFLRRWSDPASVLHSQVPLLWFEFDAGVPGRVVRVPNVLVCIDPGFWDRRPAASAESVSRQTFEQVIDAALPSLLGKAPPEALRRSLLACHAALPEGGRIFHLSVMMVRRPAVVKLNVALPRERLVDYLRALDWPGDLGAVAALADRYCSRSESVTVDLGVGEPRVGRLGLEFFEDDTYRSDPRRQDLLDRLVADGLCTEAKRAALHAWTGTSEARYEGQAWPCRLDRRLDLKIVYQHRCPSEAKAYLGYSPRFSLL
jgi:hypothetical protein